MLNKTDLHNITPEMVSANHRRYQERVAFYKSMGFDQEQARKNIIAQIGNATSTVLEIGTGKAYLTVMLAKKYPSVFSVDISDEDQQIAHLNAIQAKVIDRISFEIIKENKINFRDYNFDTVVSSFTFHHMQDPYPMINEMIRLFKHNLVISDFNDNGYKIVDKAHQSEGREHHKEDTDFNDVMSYLENKGLVVSEKEDEWQKIFIATRK